MQSSTTIRLPPIPMVKSLVIGYGNSLRSDDGIGVRVAQIVSAWHLPDVRSLCPIQLTPDLAAELILVDLVIFVDAGLDREEIDLKSLYPLDSIELRSHGGDPRAILNLTQAIYGQCPQAWWLIVPGVNFQIGEDLSPIAQQGISQSLTQIKNLIANFPAKKDLCTKLA